MPFKIAYLDDEIWLCEAFVDNFGSESIEIRTYVNPQTAISEINATMPDLVFLDYRLPGMFGDEVAKRLHPSLPKALITGDLSIDSHENFVKVFHKPFDFLEMESFIQYFMDQKRRLHYQSRQV